MTTKDKVIVITSTVIGCGIGVASIYMLPDSVKWIGIIIALFVGAISYNIYIANKTTATKNELREQLNDITAEFIKVQNELSKLKSKTSSSKKKGTDAKSETKTNK